MTCTYPDCYCPLGNSPLTCPGDTITEIANRPYLSGDWCVDYTSYREGETIAHFDDQQAAQDWINLNRLSLRDALKASLE